MMSFVFAWGTVVFAALRSEGITLTKKFAEYLNPNTIIIGVEIDKMIAVLIVGGFLVLSVIRKKRLLNKFVIKLIKESALEKLVGKNSLASFDIMSKELVPGFGKVRNASTMMIDLRGFSRLSYTISPEKIIKILGEYQTIAAEAIFKNGGSIDKYLGDGILAHFGVINDLPGYSAQALKTAEALDEKLSLWVDQWGKEGIELGFGISITNGPVIFGVIGHEERMEITTLGESVNLAAKLEKHTKELQSRILTTTQNYDLAVSQNFVPRFKRTDFPRETISGIPHEVSLVGLKNNL
ncbi:MAG: adenylate/guanylate cyclase domain-containing protein [Bacteriovoracaceae bacterium]|nr:adenylate/guanylate cyclase domain-containing protein [Bacteriovoracaceae bacterium]